MKILCIADEKDSLVYSVNITDRFKDVDLILSAGDLPLKYYEFVVSSLNKPFYFIFGNHHTTELGQFQKNSSMTPDTTFHYHKARFSFGVGGDCLDGKVMRDRSTGLLLAGLGGSMRYNQGPHQFNEFEMFVRLAKMIPKLVYNRIRFGKYVDILLTHAPPRGIGDGDDRCHTGFRVFLWFMRRFKPRYLLHGHVHLFDLNAPRISRYYETDVINIFSSYVLERV